MPGKLSRKPESIGCDFGFRKEMSLFSTEQAKVALETQESRFRASKSCETPRPKDAQGDDCAASIWWDAQASVACAPVFSKYEQIYNCRLMARNKIIVGSIGLPSKSMRGEEL